ncbi:hypothetical protein GUI12_00205 [Anaplasmataceae bacterium AB001_6]|nr:hypothetical protein GUI12_00205 [Anaplasmataceae bacterium AB001_6]
MLDKKSYFRNSLINSIRNFLFEISGQDDCLSQDVGVCFYKVLEHFVSGYNYDVSKIFNMYERPANLNVWEIVDFEEMHFLSICAHHLTPMSGILRFSYVPDKNIVSMGSMRRLIECYSKRLQSCEQLCLDIFENFDNMVNPRALSVSIDCLHFCTLCDRGTKTSSSISKGFNENTKN